MTTLGVFDDGTKAASAIDHRNLDSFDFGFAQWIHNAERVATQSAQTR